MHISMTINEMDPGLKFLKSLMIINNSQ